MTCLHHVYTYIDSMFTQCIQTLSSTWDPFYNSSLFEDMFAQRLKTCWQTCLHHVYRYAHTMFTLTSTTYLQTYLYHVYKHLCSMLEDVFVLSHIYTVLGDMLTLYLKACLYKVWKHLYSRYAHMFARFCKKCLQNF